MVIRLPGKLIDITSITVEPNPTVETDRVPVPVPTQWRSGPPDHPSPKLALASSSRLTSARRTRSRWVGAPSGTRFVRFTIEAPLVLTDPFYPSNPCPEGSYSGCHFEDVTEVGVYGSVSVRDGHQLIPRCGRWSVPLRAGKPSASGQAILTSDRSVIQPVWKDPVQADEKPFATGLMR